ncbi:MAG: hypothetical protein N2C14_01200 [Planctomycetales bacterium]
MPLVAKNPSRWNPSPAKPDMDDLLWKDRAIALAVVVVFFLMMALLAWLSWGEPSGAMDFEPWTYPM